VIRRPPLPHLRAIHSPKSVTIIVRELQSSLRLRELLSIDMEENLTPRSPDFAVVAPLRTMTFESLSSSCFHEADFRSLSMPLVVHGDQYVSHPQSSCQYRCLDEGPRGANPIETSRGASAARKADKEGHEWDVEESSVRVKGAQYVYTVFTICGILVAGGLTVGFTVGQRLRGVNPFGIATFSFVLAGFIILIANSIRVNDWPWRDFVLERVTCQSLSELRVVTSVDEQDLLLYLLAKESEDVLTTRGPYNKMYTRKGDSGFSIDIEPEIRTLLYSSVNFVKVSMSDGSALIRLDLRRGSKKRYVRTMIRHIQGVDEGDLVAQYPPRPGDKIQDVELSQSTQSHMYVVLFRWRKILGISFRRDKSPLISVLVLVAESVLEDGGVCV
jgi:hypothetical protein